MLCKFVVFARLRSILSSSGTKQRLKATFSVIVEQLSESDTPEDVSSTVISLLSFGTFLDDKERRNNIGSLEIKLSTVT